MMAFMEYIREQVQTRDISYVLEEKDDTIIYTCNNEKDQQLFYRLVLVVTSIWSEVDIKRWGSQMEDIYMVVVSQLEVYPRSISLIKLVTSLQKSIDELDEEVNLSSQRVCLNLFYLR